MLAAGGLAAAPASASIPGTFLTHESAAIPGSNGSYALGSMTKGSKSVTAVVRYGIGKASTSAIHNTAVLSTIAAGSKTAVWVGGYSYSANAYHPVILKRAGSKWSNVALPALGLNASITAMSASSANNAWAVGNLPSTNGETSVVLHWNGKKWTAVNTTEPTGTLFSAVSTSGPTNAWAVAQSGVVHWNGKTWSPSNQRFVATQLSITTSGANQAWMIGTMTGSNGLSQPYSARYNGKKWVKVKTPKYYTSTLLNVAMHGKSVWAVGDFVKSRTSSSETPLLLHSTGTSWHRVSVPKEGSGGDMSTVAATSSSRATIMGQYLVGKGCTAKSHFLVYTVHGSKVKRASTRIDMAGTPAVRNAPDC
jgi:hypothetical protein